MFFALWPSHALQGALAEATQDVVVASGGRAIPHENLHVTLAFVGSVPAASVAEVQAVGHQVAAEVERGPLQLTFDAIEYWRKAKVLCATARVPQHADGRLAETLATVLKSRLTGSGFTPDLKPFRAHVTVARKAVVAVRATAIRPVVCSFSEFALVESRTEAQGSVYRVLESFPLFARTS